jgi:hypothetical protein
MAINEQQYIPEFGDSQPGINPITRGFSFYAYFDRCPGIKYSPAFTRLMNLSHNSHISRA